VLFIAGCNEQVFSITW